MSLLTRVKLEEQGAVSPDDGNSAWRSTLLEFGWGRTGVVADIQVDGYSGQVAARILRNDLGLSPKQAGLLTINLYRICGTEMREADSDLGDAVCDLEPLVRKLFNRTQAETLLRKFGTAAVAAREAATTEPTTGQGRGRIGPYEPIRTDGKDRSAGQGHKAVPPSKPTKKGLMMNNKSNKAPDDPPRRPYMAQDVKVLKCIAANADDPEKGEPIAVVTVRFAGEADKPLIIKLPDAQRLAGALIRVLAEFADPMGQKVAENLPDDWPAFPPAAEGGGPYLDVKSVTKAYQRLGLGQPQPTQSPQAHPPVRPSRRPQMPQAPISATEAWRMTLTLRNCQDHETFMRFIGAITDRPPQRRPPRRKRGK